MDVAVRGAAWRRWKTQPKTSRVNHSPAGEVNLTDDVSE